MGSFFFRELQLISCVNVPKHLFRSSRPEVLFRKGVFRNFAIKETLAQMFSCEFCEISKNTCFYRTPPVAVSLVCQFLETTFRKCSENDKLKLYPK